jgi:(p)ppGpp synthase/HD superfamily hydrolase
MSTLQRAIEIAVEAHKGQTDKAGAPYVLHPLRVMLSLKTEAERIVGVLHDVVEDCQEWSFDRLRAEGYSLEIIEALRSVTKTEAEEAAIKAAGDEEAKYLAYWSFVSRAIQDPIGRQVKMADLKDNCDISRIENPTASDYARLKRYQRVIQRIEAEGRASTLSND